MLELTIIYKNGGMLNEKVEAAYIHENRLFRCVYDKFNQTHWESIPMDYIDDVVIIEL